MHARDSPTTLRSRRRCGRSAPTAPARPAIAAARDGDGDSDGGRRIEAMPLGFFCLVVGPLSLTLPPPPRGEGTGNAVRGPRPEARDLPEAPYPNGLEAI